MKIKRTLLTVLLAISLSLSFTGNLLAQTTEELREEVHRTFPLSADGRISLENISGAVKITGWDRNEVKLDAVKRAYTRERLDEAKISIVSDANRIDINTEYPDDNYRFSKGDDRGSKMASVDYTLTVPRGARLDGIELVSGSLEIEGLTGDVKASLVSGNATARGLSGEARLSTVSGRLDATFNHLDASKPISLGSVSGPLTVTIPSDANAQLRASTVSGSITNDFGLPVRRGDYVGRDLSGTLGSGGPRIKLSNVSGAITIRHAADGRPLSPATNQLPETGRDDDGDDNDDDDDDDVGNQARDARRAGRQASRDAAREATRAQAEARDAVRAAQVDAQREAREAQAEAAREARQAQQDAMRDAREARLEAEREARAAQVEGASEAQRAQAEARRDAERAVRESRREIERANVAASRETARAAARAARDATRDVYGNDEQDLRLVERESKSFQTSGVPRVVLDTFDGRISIRAWDKSEVMLTAIKRAGNEQALRGISVKATQQGSEINIQTNYDRAAGRRTGNIFSTNASVTLEVFVPRNTNIQAHSGDGRVELEGVTGGVMLQTGDGRIEVRDSGGQLIAKTGDGRIEVLNYTGDVDARTGDGRINLEGRFAQLAARTGTGSILLALPADMDATIETGAESVTGDGLTLLEEPGTGKKLRRFKIGRGGNVFRLDTSDGSIFLRRR